MKSLEVPKDHISREIANTAYVRQRLCEAFQNGCKCRSFSDEIYTHNLTIKLAQKEIIREEIPSVLYALSKDFTNLITLLAQLRKIFREFKSLDLVIDVFHLLLENKDVLKTPAKSYVRQMMLALVSFLQGKYSQAIMLILQAKDLDLPEDDELRVSWIAWEIILRSKLGLFLPSRLLEEIIVLLENYGTEADEFNILLHAILEWSYENDCPLILEFLTQRVHKSQYPAVCISVLEILLNLQSVLMTPIGPNLYKAAVERTGKYLSTSKSTDPWLHRCSAALKLIRFVQTLLSETIDWDEFHQWHLDLLKDFGKLEFQNQIAYRAYLSVVTCKMGNKIPSRYFVADLQRLFLRISDLFPWNSEADPTWIKQLDRKNSPHLKTMYIWGICDTMTQLSSVCREPSILSALEEMILWLPGKMQSRLFKKITATKLKFGNGTIDLEEVLNITESILISRGDIEFTPLDVAELLASSLLAILEKNLELQRSRARNQEDLNEIRNFVGNAIDRIFYIFADFLKRGEVAPSQAQIIMENILTALFHLLLRGSPGQSLIPHFILPDGFT